MERTIDVTLYDEDGDSRRVEFPAKRIVCEHCEGEGRILNKAKEENDEQEEVEAR
jgi:hypothetical protein